MPAPLRRIRIRRISQGISSNSGDPLLSGADIEELLDTVGSPSARAVAAPAIERTPRSGYIRAVKISALPDVDGIEEIVDGITEGWDDSA